MKYFVYKCLILIVSLFVLYHATVGYSIKKIEVGLSTYFNKEKISFIRDKIREEMKNSLSQDRILNPEDAKLLGEFIDKIMNEIKESK